MEWVAPLYSRSEVDAAGVVLAEKAPSPDALAQSLLIINNWRASHHFPLNTFQSTLRRKVESYADSLVVQRIKRLGAIQHKLQKHTDKPIPLSEMQDIGGCRAVLKNESQVQRLCGAYHEGDLKHELLRKDDYIRNPKYSGYRGIHLIYSYKSDKKATYNGLKIEVQLRSQLQHAWATAVEIVGFFRRELLKSSEGDVVWKQFFKLMAAEIAFQEKAALGVPGTPSDRNKLRDQLCRCEEKLDAINYLGTLGSLRAMAEMDTSNAHYFLLELDIAQKSLRIRGYTLSARERASMDYAAVEKAIFGSEEHDAVLVSADSFADLKRGYVNYFLDINRFVQAVENITKGKLSGAKTASV